ncbi:tRNA (adenosine(37)-N6)-threonylcarbamoyltransferase complex ATPase subunit type 1 TsaE [Desulfogranum mediterraneum]|uniref:tRNA (adenosine(37)-N6)-threonylcarbamoyltransferase complex ATPase subunit type 1 TsaE n=1 Tax=Desulfogranum mediterraneum TaxID=160661 RepID=UPI0003FDE0C9|nr:tRNA (adenosine(37)-N6)-threonylcarbamoyltransferase complex ATPase subunit type 1 TsaE [Desulfogranum mediterraneum]
MQPGNTASLPGAYQGHCKDMRTDDNQPLSCPGPMNLDQLSLFGRQLAGMLLPGDLLLLQGELGAGKTTLVQQIAQGLEVGADQYVSSPSYALLHEYSGRLPVYHMDLYRLSGEEDVEGAGLLDYLNHQGVTLIEWPDRLGSLLPDQYLEIHLAMVDEERRRLTLICHGKSWQLRCRELERLKSLPGAME